VRENKDLSRSPPVRPLPSFASSACQWELVQVGGVKPPQQEGGEGQVVQGLVRASPMSTSWPRVPDPCYSAGEDELETHLLSAHDMLDSSTDLGHSGGGGRRACGAAGK
jgi:hypothetical protein